MKTLLINNSFEPYYAGRDADACKWTIRKKNRDSVEEVKVEHCDKPARTPPQHEQEKR